jgi:hypothetical protein
MAWPISSGLSSWMKWRPLTVVSVRFGQVRMISRRRSLMVSPGSALMKSLGTSLAASHSPYSLTIAMTSAGSPSIGSWRGQDSVGRRSSPGLANGRR